MPRRITMIGMGNTDIDADEVSPPGHELEQNAPALDAERSEFDCNSTARRQRQRIYQGLADVEAGRLIDDNAMKAWADSLGTEHDVPAPDPA